MKKDKTRTLNLDEQVLLKEMKKENSPLKKDELESLSKGTSSRVADYFTFIIAEKEHHIREILAPIEDDAVILFSSKLDKIEKFVSGTENALLLINMDEITLGVETISQMLRLNFHSLVIVSNQPSEEVANMFPKHPKIKIFKLPFNLKQIEELIEDE